MISEVFYSTVLISGLVGTLDLSTFLLGVFDSPIVLSWASVSTIALCVFVCVCFAIYRAFYLSICKHCSVMSERCF